jgi:hypothetical protein
MEADPEPSMGCSKMDVQWMEAGNDPSQTPSISGINNPEFQK